MVDNFWLISCPCRFVFVSHSTFAFQRSSSGRVILARSKRRTGLACCREFAGAPPCLHPRPWQRHFELEVAPELRGPVIFRMLTPPLDPDVNVAAIVTACSCPYWLAVKQSACRGGRLGLTRWGSVDEVSYWDGWFAADGHAATGRPY